MNHGISRVLLVLSLVASVAATAFAQPKSADADMKKERETLARYQREQVSAKAAYLKNTKDAKLKKTYVDRTVRLGTAIMVSPALAPREKYPQALKWYREALKVDPNNKEAKNNMQMIVDIYKSMGRDVPKG